MSPRSRGRPRAYDPDAALAAAMGVFWTKGYAATTLDDLSTATGMARPSLYAAFGDKHSVFAKALERFQSLMRERTSRALSESTIEGALTRLYLDTLDLYVGPDGGRGCLVFSVAVVEAARDEQLRAVVGKAVSNVEAALTARFEQAAAAGELRSDASPRDLALLATAVLHSLSIRARAGGSSRALRAWVKRAVRVLLRAE